MEFLNKNLISLILDRIRNNPIKKKNDLRNCSLLNKHWSDIVQNYYFKNKFNVLLWKKYSLTERTPNIKLTWHLAYELIMKYNTLKTEKKKATNNSYCKLCKGVFNFIKSSTRYLCEYCNNICCTKCLSSTICCNTVYCKKCINDSDFTCICEYSNGGQSSESNSSSSSE